MSSNTLFGLSPTPTCATPTPTTAIERGWWRKLLRSPYIRSRNLKSQSLCKNRRMNLGATTEQRSSTPGLYREKSPTTSASSCCLSRPRLSTARPFMSVQRFTNGSSELCDSSTTTKSRCTAIWTACWNTTSQPSTTRLRSGAAAGFRLFPGILKQHCHGNSQCRIPDLRADACAVRGVRPTDGRALPCTPHRRAGAVAGQPAGLPAAEYLQTDVADPSQQRVALLHADQPQDLLSGRRCTVVPCGAGGPAQTRSKAQKRGINSEIRVVTPVVVSGRISHQTGGKWAMN